MKRFIFLLCAFIIFSCGCKSKRIGYIPDGFFSIDKERNEQDLKWYVELLGTLQEPSLYELSNDTNLNSYRFLWLRTFDNPIALRLSLNEDGSAILNIKVADGETGFKIGKLIENKTANVTKEQVADFLMVLNQANFWHLPSKEEGGGVDGAAWILEGVKAGDYHIVLKWATKEGYFWNAALFLVTLSNLNIDTNKIY